jgi:triacylglycerol lipase
LLSLICDTFFAWALRRANMRYDATTRALFKPELGPAPWAPADRWTRDAICAELSRLAYVRFEEGQEKVLVAALAFMGFGKPLCIHNAQTNTQAFCSVSRDGTPYIAFRGTQADKVEDILSDLRFLPVRWFGKGQVHRGFLRALESVRAEIEDWLTHHTESACVVTGHSLGAAIATLMVARLDHAELVTFGSPRVGTAAFAQMFKGRPVRRYVDCADVVTRVPPPVGYKHVCRMIYVDRDGVAHAEVPGIFAILADRVLAHFRHLRRYAFRKRSVALRSLADHAPINYVSAALGTRDD